MSFSWKCLDKYGKDLFKQFHINSQGLGLACDGLYPFGSTVSLSKMRSRWANCIYKDRLEDAAKDAMRTSQEQVAQNLKEAVAPEHPECPHCNCQRTLPAPPDLDIEQMKRFLSIPIDRVYRCYGGW